MVNKATIAVQTGALDYDTAIRNEVKRLSDAGISVVEWESGYHRRLDSSIRMNVMEGVRQMNQEILNEAGEKFADGVEISAHDRPAPDHADIQGKQYTKEEYEKLNASLKRPIGTLNCMHIAFPIIYGVTKPSYTDEELRTMKEHANEKYTWQGKELNGYECTQKQRQYETEIRKAQDREKALRAAGDNVGADLEHQKAVALRKEYKAFSEHVGLKEKLNRTGEAGKPREKQKQITAHYLDITQEKVLDAPLETANVYDMESVRAKGQEFIRDGKYVYSNLTEEEKEAGRAFSRQTGMRVGFSLKVDNPERIKTSDFEVDGIRYDYKGIKGGGKQTLKDAIKRKEEQAHNFILELSKSKLTDTDAIKQNLIPQELTAKQKSFVSAEEADVLNVALFGITAKEWREANPDLKGNVRDYATINQLICLSNLENLNAVFIQKGMEQSERLTELNKIAIQQMQVLEAVEDRKLLK